MFAKYLEQVLISADKTKIIFFLLQMNGLQNMTNYGMTIQGLLGKDLLSLSMPEFKDDLKGSFSAKDDLKNSFSVKNLKDFGNNQASDPTSAYLGWYQNCTLSLSNPLKSYFLNK